MKTFLRSAYAIMLIAACFLFLFSSSCKKESDNDTNNQDLFWNENWLIGTWEATTPSVGDPIFDNKRIRIVFEKGALKRTDTVPNNVVKEWWYSGTFTWDLSAVAPWNMKFVHTDYPAGYNLIGWQSSSMLQAEVTVNNISLRIGDTVNMDPNPELDFDLDWGPYTDYTRAVPTYLDFYGDIEIYMDGVNYRADYPPNTGTMIRFAKK